MPYRKFKRTHGRNGRFAKKTKYSTEHPSWSRILSNKTVGRGIYSNFRTLLKAVADVKGLVNSEAKWVDNTYSVSPINGSPAIQNIVSCDEGDGPEQRNGRSILSKDMFIRVTAVLGSGSPTCNLRLITFMDNNDVESNPPVAGDLLTDPTNITSPINMYNGKRFTVLTDKVYALNSGTKPNIDLNIYKKLTHHVRFDGPLSTDEADGQVYFLIMTDLASAHCSVQFYSRFKFYDN